MEQVSLWCYRLEKETESWKRNGFSEQQRSITATIIILLAEMDAGES